ncbi:helix-turn-helix transcriptional regulator [Carboxylicivirga sp. A043]|uniref:helix-turn-helix domain-containing protein n=1 Tax=Carboxylicivirga litoralis TaxID=2816963 RepID=UPI0021CB5498|nr:AraC family transcriptional regulator [Carboxylicivirga sp. A043]MCU4155654.1 helix-turn-helix transcriptional regulator [Carboxylicivirga sp. A043]
MNSCESQMIECDGLMVAATCKTDKPQEHPIYYPANMLIYVEQGTLRLNINNEINLIQEGEIGLVRKYTYGTYFKTWEDTQSGFRDHIFVLEDRFIKEVINRFKQPDGYMPCTVPMVKLPTTLLLQGLMESIKTYVSGLAQVDSHLIRLKTMEAIHAITAAQPDLLHVFYEFSEPARADLVPFVENNFTHNVSLEKFAEMSGRSLSTFNRDFRKIFDTSPHKWIRQRRLELAKKLLTNTNKKASDVYLEVGFEDLAHFSRSFKSHFGLNPSEIKSTSVA